MIWKDAEKIADGNAYCACDTIFGACVRVSMQKTSIDLFKEWKRQENGWETKCFSEYSL